MTSQSRGSAAHQPGVWHAGDARRVVPMAAAPHKLPPRQLQRTVVEAFLQRKHPVLCEKRSTVVRSEATFASGRERTSASGRGKTSADGRERSSASGGGVSSPRPHRRERHGRAHRRSPCARASPPLRGWYGAAVATLARLAGRDGTGGRSNKCHHGLTQARAATTVWTSCIMDQCSSCMPVSVTSASRTTCRISCARWPRACAEKSRQQAAV